MSKMYIEILNRLFLISKRGYGGWGRSLDLGEDPELEKLFEDKGIELHTERIDFMCREEERKASERCDSRVILRLSGEDYTIQNYNVKCLRNETAVKIASFLIKKGLDADVEIMQGFRGSKVIKSIKTKRSIESKSKERQASMFSEEVNKMQHITN